MPVQTDDAKVDVLAEARSLLDAWCDRRVYSAICELYRGYCAVNGLTDGWEELVQSLKRLRIQANAENSLITSSEAARIELLIGAVSRALYT